MRVIAGKARRLPLKTIEGLDTRPTTDRIKETLFNILQNDLYDIRFLDIFSGSGGIGPCVPSCRQSMAALAVFVENNRAAVRCIQDNLKFTHLEQQATVLPFDVLAALARLEGQRPFQIIFMDPPYGKGLEQEVLTYISSHRPSFVNEDTVLIVEACLDTDFSYAEELGFEITRVKEYKTNMHVFLQLAGD